MANNSKLKHVEEIIPRAILISKKQLLVIKCGSFYYLPGGRRNPGETLQACLRREIKEELGKDATVREYLGAIEFVFENKKLRQYEVNHFFRIKLKGTMPVTSPEGLELHWIPLNKLSKIDLRPPGVDVLLQKKGRFVSAIPK
jgi:8-oxo-dGTP pyrophosphatase MutT (NUDIX family)